MDKIIWFDKVNSEAVLRRVSEDGQTSNSI